MKIGLNAISCVLAFCTTLLSNSHLAAETQPLSSHGGYAVAPAGSLDIENAPAPLYRCPITDGAADPSVVWVEEDSSWRVYYTARRANLPVQGVGWVYGTRIGIARSDDQGRTWEYEGFCQGLGRGRQAETFWAPHVFIEQGVYHLFVTYIPRIGGNGGWRGKGQIAHYTSKDGETWLDQGILDVGSDNVIDAAVAKLPDGRWLLVFRDDNSGVKTAKCVSDDLVNWSRLKNITGRKAHEGPLVFYWHDSYWLLCDEWQGLGVYQSNDGVHYKHSGLLLDKPGRRLDDNDRGRHPGVALVGDDAYLFYFTHPGRDEKSPSQTSEQTTTHEANRSSLQIAELEFRDGRLFIERDRYAKNSTQ